MHSNPNFSITQWDNLLEQATSTLNSLQTSCSTHNFRPMHNHVASLTLIKSCWHHLKIWHLACEDENTRESWAPHGKEAWHLGLEMHNCRCFNFCVLETGVTCISGTAKLFPKYCQMLAMSLVDAAAQAAQDLINTLLQPTQQTLFSPLSNWDLIDLHELAIIFKEATQKNGITDPSKAPKMGQTTSLSLNSSEVQRVAKWPDPKGGNENWASKPTSHDNCF